MKLNYFLLDVFTDTKLAGNPLAVVMKADYLSDAQMQAIAAEFNLSETGLRPPAAARLSLPPASGSSPRKWKCPSPVIRPSARRCCLGLEQRLSAVRLEEEVGLITCVIDKTGRNRATAHFSLPRMPERLGDLPDEAIIAEALGLEPGDLGSDTYRGGMYTAGLGYYMVPVRSTEILKRIRIERRGWDEIFPLDHHSVFAFVPTPDEPDNDFAARMFTTVLGSGEDPATGSAAAAMIGLLAEQESRDGHFDLSLRQGHEMGRPSLISMRFAMNGGALEHAGIGGSAILLAHGELDLSDHVTPGNM